MTIKWLWNRLMAMSLPEVAFRFKELAQKKYDQYFNIRYAPKIKELEIHPSLLPLGSFPYKTKDTLKVFDRQFEYAPGFDWHKDINSGKVFPKEFSKGLKLKDPKRGNVKYAWEINRMVFLPNICLKFGNTRDVKYLDQFVEITNSWIDENPYLIGINWARNIEVSIRLINWSLCWEILGVADLLKTNASFKSFVYEKWLPSIYLHCKYSYLNPSLFSSANNHLVSEIAALFIASSIWKFPESGKWNRYSKKMLEREMTRQHSSKGVNREEAAGYIQFSTDFFFLSFLFGKYSKNDFSPVYEQTLKNAFHYIFQIMDVKGNMLNYGDNDDGRAFILEKKSNFNNFKSLLASGAILFKDSKLKSLSAGLDAKNDILFGSHGREIFEALPTETVVRTSQLYKEEGHFIFRQENGQGQEIFMHFDAAPLGYLSIAAHGHADALSVILNVDGRPFLLDSGTFTYRSSQIWRAYFIGTLAHNTIRIDGTDQAKSVGPTLWKEHYQSTVLSASSDELRDVVRAQHDGYQKFNTNHIRTITFEKPKQQFLITDQLEISDAKDHVFEIPWHIGPGIIVEHMGDNLYELRARDTRKVSIQLPSDLPVSLIRGQENPNLGWYSTAFEIKEPCEVIYSKLKTNKSFTLSYTITIY